MDPLLYFCAKYFHETYILKPFMQQTETRMLLRYDYILELTTIFGNDIDIQGDSLPEFMGWY